jgi:hypothetical protein
MGNTIYITEEGEIIPVYKIKKNDKEQKEQEKQKEVNVNEKNNTMESNG